jgi:dipeptidyl aminopeptidase/acylaminoacyl peptidase
VALFANNAGRSINGKEWIRDFYGKISEEYEEFKSQSPVYMAEELQRPLLIAHGREDRIVDIEHAYRLKLALEKYNKPIIWFEYPDQGHSFDSETLVEFMPQLLSFVRDSLTEN